MDREEECVCCHEIEQVANKNQEVIEYTKPTLPYDCITDNPGFHTVCLDRSVLRAAWLDFNIICSEQIVFTLLRQASINMLTELINLFLSLFSLVMNETPRVSREEEISGDSDNSEDQWLPKVHEEYENVEDMASLSLFNEDVIAYTSPGTDELSEQRQKCFWKSFRKSIWTSLSTALAVLPLTAVAMLFLYFDLKTSDFCVEWQNHNNALSFSVQRLRFIGDAVEVILINLWCPLTFILLFGWKKFKAYFPFTFLVGFIFGDASVIYYYALILFRFGNIVARTRV